MKKKLLIIFPLIILLGVAGLLGRSQQNDTGNYISFVADPSKQQLKMFWKDSSKNIFHNFGTLKSWLAKNHQELVFAMNGGMYMEDRSPLGLYIENGKTLARLNKASAGGNFYLKPNGVFYISKNKTASIVTTEKFIADKSITYATQSGPMLLANGKINTPFTKGSVNVNIRNGVEYYRVIKFYLRCRKCRSTYTTLQNTLTIWVAKMRYISMDSFPVHTCLKKNGYKRMGISA